MAKRGRILFGVLGIMVLALLAFQTPLLAALRTRTWDAWVGTLARLHGLGALETQDNVTLQLSELRVENIRLNSELARYQRLERQLGVPAFRTFRNIPALVGPTPIDRFRAHYFLNRGAVNGVVLGAPVVTQGSILVGFVKELAPKSSVVQLLFHPATSVPVEISAQEEGGGVARGLLKGQSFTSLALTTVPRDQELKTGMVITTTAYEDFLPAGLIIGTVGAIQSTERDAYQQASVDLPYDPDALEAANILVPEEGNL